MSENDLRRLSHRTATTGVNGPALNINTADLTKLGVDTGDRVTVRTYADRIVIEPEGTDD